MTLYTLSSKTLASFTIIALLGIISPIASVNAVATLTEITPVASPTNNPTYTFNSDVSGSIAYGGPCTSSFNLAIVGVNSIVFNTGAEGTFAACTVSVNDGGGLGPNSVLNLTTFVIDTTVPAISLLGSAVYNILRNEPYSDPGANWTDNIDGAGPAILTMTGITASGTVGPTSSGVIDTSFTGSYTYSYNYTDVAGNIATERKRTVNVVNGDIPVLTLVGTTPLTIPLGGPYNEDGATATDTEDDINSIPLNVIITGSVDVNTPGTYVITYNVTDSNGNAAIPITRSVDVMSGDIPVITLLGTTPTLHELGTSYTDSGATATDLQDGPVISTANIVASGLVNTGVTGTYYIDYNVTDSNLNPAITVTRTVIVADRTPPVLTLIGSGTINILRNSAYADSGAVWVDAIDGSGAIVSTGLVNTGVLGTYILPYYHADVAGNAAISVSRTVNVLTGNLPIITLNGSGTINIILGSGFVDPGFTISDIEDGDLTASGTISGSVNTGIPGIYPVQYSVTDSHLNTVTVTRIVNILDIIPPVVTLLGSGSITIDAGTTYTDMGATWTDNIDGSGSIVANGTVNTNVGGLYVLSYNYTDSSGNVGIAQIRNVVVVGSVSTGIQNGPGGGGGGGGTATVSSKQTSLNAAPSTITTGINESQDLLIPSILRLLRQSLISANNTISSENNSASEMQSDSMVTTHTIDNPVTDYICPVVTELPNIDKTQLSNVSEGEFTSDVQALFIYRSTDNEDVSAKYTERYFASKGYGIVKSNEAYDGNRAITRAEFIKMLVRALSCHYTASDTEKEFSDVSSNAWYTEYVNFAINNGWVKGYADGTFAPHGLITRGEMAQVLGKSIHLNTNIVTMDTTIEMFHDVPLFHPAAPYIYALREHGIIDGKEESLYDIQGNVTRNEIARIFNKTFLNIKK